MRRMRLYAGLLLGAAARLRQLPPERRGYGLLLCGIGRFGRRGQEEGRGELREGLSLPLYDPVNHPSHYTLRCGIDCIDAMAAAFGKETVEDFCLCNAFKYVWRTRKKNGLEDCKKAQWYLNKYVKMVENEVDK